MTPNCDPFIRCLKKHGIISNENEAKSLLKNGKITFKLPEHSNSQPVDIKDVSATIICDSEIENDKEFFPNYSKYCFLIVFSGKDINDIEYRCSWHLDYESKSLDESSEEPKVFHPLFHLTYGGAQMSNLYEHLEDSGYSDVKDRAIYDNKVSFIPLLLIAPRIPFPPMDIYLGIDFVICNFMNKKDYQKLQTETEYKFIIKNSQEQLWKPYYSTMSNNWDKKSSVIAPRALNQMLI